jgi:hypothetical protein
MKIWNKQHDNVVVDEEVLPLCNHYSVRRLYSRTVGFLMEVKHLQTLSVTGRTITSVMKPNTRPPKLVLLKRMDG